MRYRVYAASDVTPAGSGSFPADPAFSIVGGTVFSSLSGSTIANTAVLGSSLLPEMMRRGYVVAATDYQGQGGSGIEPFLVGDSEARAACPRQ